MSKIRHTIALTLAWTAGSAGVQTRAATPTPAPAATSIGINLSAFNIDATTAPFANLAIGSDWFIGPSTLLPEGQQDKDGNVLSAPPGSELRRSIMVPPTGPEGFDARCTFTGSGELRVEGNATPGRPGNHSLIVHLTNADGLKGKPWIVVTGFDSRHPLRDLDCRDMRVARDLRFRPEALRPLKGFRTVRFMDWQLANANRAVAWADRHVPGSLRVDRDGIAIEDMMAVANELGADPWFVMPWNADDDYITRFARLVRDQLPPGRSVYVETGNEIWNTAFPAAKQAVAEGLARKLSTDPTQAGVRRYAQRTVEVMRLWEAVFAGRPGLVRVLATQHALPASAETALSFADTRNHVDALATAPYFGETLGGMANTREAALAAMEGQLGWALNLVTANRQVAASYGKRYIAYEGGTALILPAQADLREQIQHDQALYGLMQRFLAGWAQRSGDVLCLYNSIQRPGPWGNWGLAETERDTRAAAPKLSAAQEFIVAHPNR